MNFAPFDTVESDSNLLTPPLLSTANVVEALLHEIKNPLWSIQLCNRMMLQSSPEQQADLVNDIETSQLQISAILETVLFASRLETDSVSVQVNPVNITSLIKNVLSSFDIHIKAKNIITTLSVVGSEFLFNTDVQLFRLMISNLLSNAVKYSSLSGNAEINIMILFSDTPTNRQIVIDIYNNGQAMGVCFDSTHTNDDLSSHIQLLPSTKIGCSLIKRISNLLSISVQCEVGRVDGTLVRLVLNA